MADAQTPVLTDEQIFAIANAHVRSVTHPTRYVLAALPFARAILAAQAPALPGPTMADALAAGDGTLHGAVDHWQQQALAGRAVMQQALDALEYHVEQTRPIERTTVAIASLRAALSATMEKPCPATR